MAVFLLYQIYHTNIQTILQYLESLFACRCEFFMRLGQRRERGAGEVLPPRGVPPSAPLEGGAQPQVGRDERRSREPDRRQYLSGWGRLGPGEIEDLEIADLAYGAGGM